MTNETNESSHVAPELDSTKQAENSSPEHIEVEVALVLLCYKNGRRQQGHPGSERARWVAIWRRRVVMECGLCRSTLERNHSSCTL
jgi:hypothetical protein